MAAKAGEGPSVALFATCLVDLFRPNIGFAAVKLLEDAGCRVFVPTQTCCGQPAYNSGDTADARALAEQAIAACEAYDYVVVPSGSCAGQLKIHFPELFALDQEWEARARAFSAKSFELVSFLSHVLGRTSVAARFVGAVTYHDSCSGLRELAIKEEPRKMLASISGLTLSEMAEAETCCGFGGLFCVKYPEISNAIVEKKASFVEASGADTLLGGDLGCLMNMAGKLQRRGAKVKVRHVAEVLAGMAEGPAIGEKG